MAKLRLRTTLMSLSTAVVLGMTGCSSGGSDDPVQESLDTVLSGVGIDGYLSQATVCLDLNLDGYCQIDDEPATSTKDNGSFSLTLTVAQKQAYPEYAKAPLLIYSGYDVDTGVEFTGKLRANLGDGQNINVSPLSTAVKAVMDSDKTEEEAETLVKDMLGLGSDVDLKADPVAEAKENPALLKAALKLQKTIEVLAAAKKKAGSAESDNKLVEDLYKKLADEAVSGKKLDKAVEQVVEDDGELDAEAEESATLITGQIDLIIGDKGIADTAVIGTKIGAVKQELIVAIESDASVPSEADLNTTANTDFSLLHAKEILRIVDMEDIDTTAGNLSEDVQKVLTDGGMTETEFLPVETEIKLLKADAKTFLVGAKFEDFRNAGRDAENARLEAEAAAAAEKAALDAKIKELEDQIAATADADAKEKLEAEKKAADDKAVAAAEAAEAKAEEERLARLKEEADAAVLANLLTAEELAKIESDRLDAVAAEEKAKSDAEAAALVAQELAAKQLADAINLVGDDVDTILQTATTAKTTAEAQLAKAKKDAEDAQKIADEYPAAATAAATANSAYASAQSAATAAQAQYEKIQAASTAVSTATTLESANAELIKAQEALKAGASSLTQLSSSVTASATALTLAKTFVTNVDTSIDVAELKTSVTALYSDKEAKDGATVTDAKNMFAQLRETVVTFIDLDSDVDAQSSTLVGSQFDTLKTKIQPALEAIGEDFNQSAIAMQDSVEAFGVSVESDFNTTIESIKTRVEALTSQTENFSEDQNWSVTAGSDTLSRTVSVDNSTTPSIETQVITLNSQSITLKNEVVPNDDPKPVSVTTNGSLSLVGTNYNLNVTNLSFVDKRVTLKVNGDITGENGSKMSLTNLDLAMDVDFSIDGMDALSNIALTFDGTILSSGRTLVGKLLLSENLPSVLDGAFTGLSGEPSFVGKVTLNTSLNSLVSDAAINDNATSLWTPLVMVNFDDGSQSFMTSWSQEYITSNSDENSTTYFYNYVLNTQSENNVTCYVTDHSFDKEYTPVGYYYKSHEHNISCDNGVTLTPYSTYDGKVTAEFNGEERVIKNVWSNYEYSNGAYTQSINLNVNNEGMTYIDESGKMYLNGELVTIANIKITPSVNMLDRTFDFKFDGNITDGSKNIVATIGVNRALESEVYAQNILITDGASSVKMDELSVISNNEDFINLTDTLDNDDHYSSSYSSQFENYSYSYNYNNDEEESTIAMKVKVVGLSAYILDADSSVLTLNADAIYDTNETNSNVLFDGTYEYAGAKFVGHIDANGTNHEVTKIEENGYTDTYNEVIGTANVFGSIEANGFIPFDITATLTTEVDENFVGYAKFTRDSSYELGIYVSQENNSASGDKTIVVNLGDSNGVLGSLTKTENTKTGVENNPTLNVTNKSGTSLATYGEDINGNEWEIVYSDNTSETLF